MVFQHLSQYLALGFLLQHHLEFVQHVVLSILTCREKICAVCLGSFPSCVCAVTEILYQAICSLLELNK